MNNKFSSYYLLKLFSNPELYFVKAKTTPYSTLVLFLMDVSRNDIVRDDNLLFHLVFICCLTVLIIVCMIFSITIGIIASKYQSKDPNFFVNQVFEMNDSLSPHCLANWRMNFTIHNDNVYSSYFYKGFEILAYHEDDEINNIFARAEILPFNQGPKNRTIIHVDFLSLVAAENYKSTTFSLEFRGIAYTHTNVAKFVRTMAQLDEEYIIKGKCENLMFGMKESTTTNSPKECFLCYYSYSSGHEPCWY